MIKRTPAQIRTELVKTLVLLVTGVVMVAPFVWMISVSLERYANIQPPFPPRLIPEEPSLFNYKIVVENGTLLKAYLSSAIVAVGTLGVGLVSSLMAGYAFSKGRFRGRSILLIAVLATMMIPFEVRLIPLFLMFNRVRLTNTYWPLILPHLLYGFGAILSKQYFDALPESLREAAKIDGAGEFFIFRRVFVPLAGPMIASAVVLLFMGSWNDFLWPLIVLTSQKLQTVPIYLSKFSLEDGTRLAGLSMALSSASIVPVIIVFLIFQRFIIQSVALSGIKGE
jgi:multiple sugar transport system permease protein